MNHEDVFDMLDLCTIEIIRAVKVKVPYWLPQNLVNAAKFLIEKTLEKSGMSVPIIIETDYSISPPKGE